MNNQIREKIKKIIDLEGCPTNFEADWQFDEWQIDQLLSLFSSREREDLIEIMEELTMHKQYYKEHKYDSGHLCAGCSYIRVKLSKLKGEGKK
jgi:hypothetical protein